MALYIDIIYSKSFINYLTSITSAYLQYLQQKLESPLKQKYLKFDSKQTQIQMKIIINSPDQQSDSNSIVKTFTYDNNHANVPYEQFCHMNIHNTSAIIVCDFCQSDITLQPNVFVYQKQSQSPHLQTAKCKQYCWGCFAKIVKNVDHKQFFCYHGRHNSKFTLTCSQWTVFRQVLLLQTIQKFGVGNWFLVAQTLCMNRCPVTQKQVQSHYSNFYLDNQGFQPFLQEIFLQTSSSESNFDWRSFMQSETKSKINNSEVKIINQVNVRVKIDQDLIEIQQNSTSNSSTKCQEEEQTQYDTNKGQTYKNNTKRNSQKKGKNRNRKKKSKVNQHQEGRHPIEKYFQNYRPGINDQEYTYYIEQRQEFQWEYDPFAECIISDLQFNDSTDQPIQVQMKLGLLRQYNRRLKERIQRKKFAVQHKLLDIQTAKNKKRRAGDKLLYKSSIMTQKTQNKLQKVCLQRLRPFTRYFHSPIQLRQCQNLMINVYHHSSLIDQFQKLRNNQKITKIIDGLKKVQQTLNQNKGNLKKQIKFNNTIKRDNSRKNRQIYKNIETDTQQNRSSAQLSTLNNILSKNDVQTVQQQYKLMGIKENEEAVKINAQISLKPFRSFNFREVK